ncbi:MAG: SAM-dependent methyltransferase, partial [Devosiaceae bacterium]|nr:SAM-dependent methyltransferase [Devosiaceae bacterium]
HLPHTDYDLIISLFDIGFTNNVPGFLNQIFGHLGKDGLFISAFIGGTSFNELRSAWLMADDTHMGGALTRVAPFIDIKDAGSLLQRTGFALPVTDKETLCLRYETPLHLMREIKLFGGSNPLVSAALKPVTRSHLNTAIDAYAQIATDTDGRIRSTLEIIWMSGWKPDASQQKPLKPGSAQISLTKVLGTGKK